MLLGDLGADIIKVEPPGGDPTRGYGPPYVRSADGGDDRGESTYYLSTNRNKRGISLDLRLDAGREVLRRLVERSDVLVENQRPGALARLGFPDEELERLNPALIHLSITGYGPDGPAADRPGYDFIIQAVAGVMSITGAPDEEGGEPTKVGVAISDLTTGMLGAVAVLAALRARDRPGAPAGGGQRIDLSLFESTIAWLANQAAAYLLAGVVPGRMGNRHPSITPYETYRTADGVLAVAVGSERQWAGLCEALAIDELAGDARYRTNADRVEHREGLRAILDPLFAEGTTAEWLTRLDAADVPVAPISDLAAVFADPQTAARRMIERVDHPTLGQLRLAGIPFKLAGTPATVRRHPPRLGEHTDEVLGWLGYDEEERRRLRASRAC